MINEGGDDGSSFLISLSQEEWLLGSRMMEMKSISGFD